MLSNLRHRLLGLRLFWMVMLLLGTVLKPAMVMACETHESQHQLMTGHGHDNAEHTGSQVADESLPGAETTPWHSLLHQGHCCVQGAAIVALVITTSSTACPSPPDVAQPPLLIKARLAPSLRPPIRD